MRRILGLLLLDCTGLLLSFGTMGCKPAEADLSLESKEIDLAPGKEITVKVKTGKAVGGIVQTDKEILVDVAKDGLSIRVIASKDAKGSADYTVMGAGDKKATLKVNIKAPGS
jgi:hypothetical protein